jgi:hypothetical protein
MILFWWHSFFNVPEIHYPLQCNYWIGQLISSFAISMLLPIYVNIAWISNHINTMTTSLYWSYSTSYLQLSLFLIFPLPPPLPLPMTTCLSHDRLPSKWRPALSNGRLPFPMSVCPPPWPSTSQLAACPPPRQPPLPPPMDACPPPTPCPPASRVTACPHPMGSLPFPHGIMAPLMAACLMAPVEVELVPGGLVSITQREGLRLGAALGQAAQPGLRKVSQQGPAHLKHATKQIQPYRHTR